MLNIVNVDKIVGEERGKYKIHSVKDFTNSYAFAVLDTDEMRYFRIDLMKERDIDGWWVLRYSPKRYRICNDASVWNKDRLIEDMVELIIFHRKPIKTKI